MHQYGYLNPPIRTNVGDPIPSGRSIFLGRMLSDVTAMTNPNKLYLNALKTFQRRYSLPVTGKLDSQTLELLSAPRCGNPDVNPVEGVGQLEEMSGGQKGLRRKKRYLIGDPKMRWTKKKLTWQ